MLSSTDRDMLAPVASGVACGGHHIQAFWKTTWILQGL